MWQPLKGPVRDANGNITGLFGISRDVSALLRAQEETRNALLRLTYHVEHTPLAFVEFDEGARVRSWSLRAQEIFGWTADEVRGKHPSQWRFIHEDDVAAVEQRIRECSAGDFTSDITRNRNYHKDGRTLHCEWYTSIMSDESGKVSSMLCFAHDITDSVNAEAARDENRSKLESVLRNTNASVFMEDLAGRFTLANAKLCRLTGLEESQILGKTADELFSPEAAQMMRDSDRRTLEAGETTETEETMVLEGETIYFVTTKSPLTDETGAVYGICGIATDITSMRRASDELRRADQRLRFHVENTPLAVVEWDDQWRVRGWSEQAYQLFGWRLEEIVDKHPENWQFVHVDDEERTFDRMNRLAAGEYVSFVNENRNYTKDGRVVHTEWYNSGLMDESGKVVSVMSLVHDVTERVTAEQELRDLNRELENRVRERTQELTKAQAELLRSTRLATLGQLTATVSHELRNPLSTMRTSLYLLDKQVETRNDKIQENFDRLDRNVVRCDRIIDELLDFTRISDIDKRPLDLDNWLDELLADLVLPADVQLVRKRGLAGHAVCFDPDRLRRAIINIYDNACDAIAEMHSTASKMEISTRRQGSRIEICIADTGPGMTPEMHAEAFEPLRSSKTFGVGLGLPTVKQILEQHGGEIEIHTELGSGTQVTLSLPNLETSDNTLNF